MKQYKLSSLFKTNAANNADAFAAAVTNLAEAAARSLPATAQYLYAVSHGDFYGVGVKDVFKVALTDIGNPSILGNLGLRFPPEAFGETGAEDFARVGDMAHYALALRFPYLKRLQGFPLKDGAIRQLFASAIERGAVNPGDIIAEDFAENEKLQRKNLTEPEWSSLWFRRLVYTKGGELAAINNRNMFLFGCTDVFFPLFYSAYLEKMKALINIYELQSRT
ncbi:MAG: hypothetical protein LBN40_05285 [Oscillospiraceae bacterium]|jgi:hypothetical protein|nr:hypothetical protein [Oscillospiraceae bacterium]